MDKLRFEFTVKSTLDGKSNVIVMTSIGTVDNRIFHVPEELQVMNLHKLIMETSVYESIKKTLRKRHQTRRVWIVLTDQLKKTYMDEQENLQFDGYFLEEITQSAATSTGISEESLTRILEKLTENKQQSHNQQNVKILAEKFVIEKFTGKDSNAYQWMEVFEKECDRFNIKQDIQKIEIFRLFLENSCLNWYSSMLIKFTLNSEWIKWKDNFNVTYTNKGWTSVRYAFSFRYKNGSLLDYALKKERLLLEIRKSIDTGSLIDLIAVGLPNFVSDKINREDLAVTEDLFKEIGKLEHLVNKTFFEKSNTTNYNTKEKFEKQKQCRICEKLKKGNRYHPESSCWFKKKEEENNKIKNVNNSELEVELNNNNQKN